LRWEHTKGVPLSVRGIAVAVTCAPRYDLAHTVWRIALFLGSLAADVAGDTNGATTLNELTGT